jgi:antirestriction protein ArdC
MNSTTGTNNMNTTTKSVEQLYVLSIEEAMASIKFSADKAQINGSTNREYSKVNQLILVGSQTAGKFTSNKWFSVEQIKEAGLSIKKDEKGTMLFNSSIKEDESRTYVKEGETKNFKIKKYSYYYVFNENQLEKQEA